MKTKTISAIMVLALVQMVSAAQTLTMNDEAVDEVTLETGQICIVQIVSDNSNPYSAYVGFDDRVVLGNFAPFGKYPEAGDLASITQYDIPAFYGYFVTAAGTSPPPSPGNHFVIVYQPQQVGETELKLYDSLRMTVIAKAHITVVPAQRGTVFTYQGRLLETGNPADGQYDFEFKLYDTPSYGIQLASTIKANDLDVIDGYFTVELDFGSDVFNGDACWLDISVRPGDSSSGFTSLGPRQRITSTPYSLQTRGIFVDSEGNVGMGTTSPEQELHVYQPVRNVYVRAESDGGFAFFQVDGTKNSGLRIEEDGTLKANVYWNTASQCLSLAYGNDDSLVVKGKNVGIGTQDPSNDLHIYDSTSNCYVDAESETGYAFFQADGHRNSGLTIKENGTVKANVYWNTVNDSLSLAEGGVERLVVKGGKVGIGTTSPSVKLEVVGSDANGVISATNNSLGAGGYGVYGKNSISGNYGFLGSTGCGVFGSYHTRDNYGIVGGSGSGVYGHSNSYSGVYGVSINGYGVRGESSQGYAGYFNGDVYVDKNCSALSFTDRTPYPKDLTTAYEAVMSMERLPDGQYDENNKEAQLDHSMLSDFIRSEDGNRDLSATVSCHNEVLKDLINKQQELGKAHTYIEQLQKQNELLEARLVKLEAMIENKPLK